MHYLLLFLQEVALAETSWESRTNRVLKIVLRAAMPCQIAFHLSTNAAKQIACFLRLAMILASLSTRQGIHTCGMRKQLDTLLMLQLEAMPTCGL